MPFFMPSDFAPRQQRQSIDPFLAALFTQMAQPGQQHEHHEQEATTPSTTAATTTTTTDSKPKTNTSKPAAKPTHTPRRTNGRTNRAFSPRFDVFETEEAYHLYGDLPGMQDKKSVSLEFSDERTLLITGRLERKPIPSTAPTTEKRRSRNPTVEDTDDEDDFSVVSGEHHEKEEWVVEEKVEERKVWLSERVFGHFQRSFSFPTPVDLEAVTAKLEAGLLEIVVPKGFVRTKRIEVQ